MVMCSKFDDEVNWSIVGTGNVDVRFVASLHFMPHTEWLENDGFCVTD